MVEERVHLPAKPLLRVRLRSDGLLLHSDPTENQKDQISHEEPSGQVGLLHRDGVLRGLGALQRGHLFEGFGSYTAQNIRRL